MAKYIDAEKLKAEIDKLHDAPVPKHDQQCDFSDGYSWGLNDIENLIDSLQQEQNFAQDTELTYFESALFTAFSYAWQDYLRGEEVNVAQWAKENSAELLEAAKFQQEQQEVDFEEEWEKFEDWMESYDQSDYPTCYEPKQIARHFFELGLNAIKED